MSFFAAPSALSLLGGLGIAKAASGLFGGSKSSSAPAAAPAAPAAPVAKTADVELRAQKEGQRAAAGALSTGDNDAGDVDAAKRKFASRTLLG